MLDRVAVYFTDVEVAFYGEGLGGGDVVGCAVDCVLGFLVFFFFFLLLLVVVVVVVVGIDGFVEGEPVGVRDQGDDAAG